jgi:hypothetical protein
MKSGTNLKINGRLCVTTSEDYMRIKDGKVIEAVDAKEIETGREFWFAVHYTNWEVVPAAV